MPAKARKTAQEPPKPETKGKVASTLPAAPKGRMGRPSIYSQQIAAEICTRIAQGESLRSICRDDAMPSMASVFLWLAQKPDFSEQYARAREEQAEVHADAIVAIADETPDVEEVRDREGNVLDLKMHSAYVQWQKNRIDARKWVAAKLKPKKYGDRVALAGDPESPIKVEAEVQADKLFQALITNAELKKQVDAS